MGGLTGQDRVQGSVVSGCVCEGATITGFSSMLQTMVRSVH